MTSSREPMIASATQHEPILICYDASVSQQVADHAGRPVPIVAPPR